MGGLRALEELGKAVQSGRGALQAVSCWRMVACMAQCMHYLLPRHKADGAATSSACVGACKQGRGGCFYGGPPLSHLCGHTAPVEQEPCA